MTDPRTIFVQDTSTEALFRYLVVSQVLACVQEGKKEARAIRLVAAREHATFEGSFRRVSRRTVYRWLARYRADGMAGLARQGRAPSTASGVIPAALVNFAAIQKEADPWTSVPEIIARARQIGIVEPVHPIHRCTVYRALQRNGVPVDRRKQVSHKEGLRFAYAHRMQMLLSDGLHFRAGLTRAKRVALFLLDDASRYGFDVVVGTSENARLFLEGLHGTVRQYGFFRIAYLDQGPGFVAGDTVAVVAKLGGLLIHGAKRYPQGHGKIERFNQTARAQCLRTLDRRPDVAPDCEALTLRLRHWLKQRYNHTPHESLEMQTPHERFHNDTAPLRLPESEHDLEKRFVLYLERRVSADHIVTVNRVHYEMPRGYTGAKVKLHRRVLTSSLHFLHEGRLIDLHPVDLHRNATTPRKSGTAAPETEHPLPPSAADLHFARDFRPVVDPDGGFAGPPTKRKEKP
jgi:putative transposase